MYNDEYVEVTNESWFSRIMSSIKSVVAGLVLFALAFPLLFWNEGRAVKRAKSLEEGKGEVISIEAKVNPSYQHKLIHISDEAVGAKDLIDPIFGIKAKGLKLVRSVEMYQWEEKKESKSEKQLGGSKETVTHYSYAKTWSSSLNPSSKFKQPEAHTNPTSMKYNGETFSVKGKLGEFVIPPDMISSLSGAKPFLVDESMLGKTKMGELGVKIAHGVLYIGNNPVDPQIGDYRVKFALLENGRVSLVARQINNSFEPYVMSNGGKVSLIEYGMHSAENMFATAESSNATMTWVLRVVGFLMMAIGLGMVLSPIAVFADVIPFLGDLVGMGLGLCAGLIAASLTFVTIAIAWLTYRPLIGGAFILLAVALVVGPKVVKGKNY